MDGHQALRPEEPIKKPVAFVLTMLDELREARLIDAASPLQVPSRHVGGFDVADGRHTLAEAHRLLCEWGGVEVGNLPHGSPTRATSP